MQPFRDGSTGEAEVAAVEVVFCLVEVDVVAAVSLELVVLAALRTARLVVVLVLRGADPQLVCPASQQCCRAPDGQEPILSQYAQQPLCTFMSYSAVTFWARWRCQEPSGQKSCRGAPAKTRSTPLSLCGPVTATSTRNSDVFLKRSVKARFCSTCDMFVGSRSDKFVGD